MFQETDSLLTDSLSRFRVVDGNDECKFHTFLDLITSSGLGRSVRGSVCMGEEGHLCTSQNAESVGNAQSQWVMDGGVGKTVDLSSVRKRFPYRH